MKRLYRKGDYFKILSEKATATVNCSKFTSIRNALTIIKNGDNIQEWQIKEYKVIQCPEPLYVCIKNLKVITGCIGNIETEPSYFQIKNLENEQPQSLSIFGAIEVDEGAIVFYFDGNVKESHYIYQASYGKEIADIFMIVKFLKNLIEQIHGKEQREENELEKQFTGEKPVCGRTFIW